MACGLPPQDCATDHLAPLLRLRCMKAGSQWAGPCPACRGPKCFSLTVAGGRKLWNCHRSPACTQDAITTAIAGLLPDCVAGPRAARERRAPARVDTDELVELALRGLPASAMKVWLLQRAGFTLDEAIAKLGLPVSTRYRVADLLGRDRR